MNGNGNGNGGPWWARLVTKVGVVGAGLLALIGWLMTSHAMALSSHAHEQEHAMDTLILITRQVCVNGATSDAATRECLQQEPR